MDCWTCITSGQISRVNTFTCIWSLCRIHQWAVFCMWLMPTERSIRETLTRDLALEQHGDGSPKPTQYEHSGSLRLWLSVALTATEFKDSRSNFCPRAEKSKRCVAATVLLCFEWEGFNHSRNWTLYLLFHYCFCMGFWNPSVDVLCQKCGGCTVRFVHIIEAVIFIMWEGFRGGCALSPKANFKCSGFPLKLLSHRLNKIKTELSIMPNCDSEINTF